jgi:perosamine synthetase
MKSNLALFGGTPVRTKAFPDYNTIDENEKKEVMEVLDTGVLSSFLGSASDGFYGGPKVKKLERYWEEYFGVKHAISMNSATSALMAAVSACNIGPGDEVILPPLTMCATGTAVLFTGAIPVFADVDPRTMNIDPYKIEHLITKRTKAIFVVHLAGHPVDMDPIMDLAKKYNLFVLGDNSQSPGAYYKGKPAGCIEHIGVFSLNCHKTIQCGEGGIAVTNDKDLALRLALVRNHGENCVKGFNRPDIHILGFNFRMTEMEAAVAYHQLRKLKMLNEWRQRLAEYLTKKIEQNFPFITPPYVHPESTHVYYLYHTDYHKEKIDGLELNLFSKALLSEGVPIFSRWGAPIYRLSIYQDLSAHGDTGYPFKNPMYDGKVSYKEGICPIAESSEKTSLFIETLVRWPNTEADMDGIVRAIQKVYDNRFELIEYQKKQGTQI